MSKKLGQKNTVKVETYHPFICTPAYNGQVDVDFCTSMVESAYVSPLYQVQLTFGCVANGAFIDLARNNFVKQFLEDNKECTHLFFIDSDLKFSGRDFIGLLRADLPICAGVYRRRQETEDYPVKYAEHPGQGGLWFEKVSPMIDGEWLMAERVPTGFLCIRRDIIEEMAAEAQVIKIQGENGTTDVPRLFYTSVLEDGRFIGEDFAFCDDYMKKYKKPIPVWPNIDFVHGGYECNLLDYLDKLVQEEDGVSAA